MLIWSVRVYNRHLPHKIVLLRPLLAYTGLLGQIWRDKKWGITATQEKPLGSGGLEREIKIIISWFSGSFFNAPVRKVFPYQQDDIRVQLYKKTHVLHTLYSSYTLQEKDIYPIWDIHTQVECENNIAIECFSQLLL